MAVKWSDAALADLARAYAFNLGRSERFAARVELRLLTRLKTLEMLPHQGRPVGATGLRAISLPDIQYVITYRASELSVQIVEVRGTREDRGW